jgi:chemotaxis family two-component system response regulator Rcp1
MQHTSSTAPAIQVLLVEDNPGDVRLTREAFRDAKVHLDMHVAADGVEAMEFLLRQGAYSQSPRPDLILLDLNLPRKDGREVLAEIKGDPSLKSIPVVILTTSARTRISNAVICCTPTVTSRSPWIWRVFLPWCGA